MDIQMDIASPSDPNLHTVRMFPLPNEERREEGKREERGAGSVARERADREETRDETRGGETKGKKRKEPLH